MLIFNIVIITVFLTFVVILLLLIKRKNAYIHETEEYYKSQLYNQKKNSSNEINKIKLSLKNEEEKSNQLQKKLDGINCIKCHAPSNGKHFCFSCYSKYKDKSFDLRIKNCKDTKIIDEWGNKTEPCEDGRYVRSRAEQCIANYFYNNKIRYAYEKPIHFNGKVLKPDFYLPDYELYIEYNELKDEEYVRKKEFAMNIYNQLNKRVIIMTKEDRENIYEYFCKLLKL